MSLAATSHPSGRTFQVRVPDGVQPEDFATLSSMAAMIERLQARQAP